MTNINDNPIKNNLFKKITFGGFFKKDVIELIKINKYDRVYIDINNTDADTNLRSIKQCCNANIIWTNIQDKVDSNDNSNTTMVKRRINIAKMLIEILKLEIQYNSKGIVLLDSDMWTMYPLSVYSYNEYDNYKYNITYGDNVYESSNITNICFLAKLKPTMFVNYFCMGTPMIIPSNYYDQLIYILNTYINDMKYDTCPIDIYIHNKLSYNHLFLNGVCHIIDNNEYCTRLTPQFEGVRRWR